VEIWERAIDLYEQSKFREALALFYSMMESYPNDSVAKVYASRCETFIESPPPPNWDAVNNLTEK